MRIYLSSLGCARNRVDTELMIGRLVAAQQEIVYDPSRAEVIVVNTCGFIKDAVQESIDTIIELAENKKTGLLKYLIVAGCLPERFKNDIVESLPEVDAFIGTGAYDQVEAVIEDLDQKTARKKALWPDPDQMDLQTCDTPRIRSTPHMAYVKIAEGCSSHCTYCIIPKLRGRHRSRSIADIRKECERLIDSGVKEIVLVAQESTFYGRDLTPETGLGALLESLAGISPHVWIRVLYGHPASMDDRIIHTISAHENICAYFDLPLQHASATVLKKMGRPYDPPFLRDLFSKIRTVIPDATLRTTLITGFPGETEKDFRIVHDFINEIRFDHLGVFIYSDEDDLPSHHLPRHVPKQTAKKRRTTLMTSQAKISLEKNRKHLNKTVKVLVEKRGADGLYVGRTSFQAPEVDGETIIRGEGLTIGDFASVTIREVHDYDIVGELT